ncbi:MAG: enoyl-CoA hydratase/isomerase family protein [Candidatus Brocadiae bacterium]|nr:enoyl-CoA hydratase/isomerase family protein [Candidatus Brocadiia bacterium]
METSKMSQWEVRENIGILSFHNPPQNYLKPEFVELTELKKWTQENSLKGMILTGHGRHFCAGMSTQKIFEFEDAKTVQESFRKGKEIAEYLDKLPIPIVAAINGVCLGAGLELALGCHIRVCSEKAVFSFPETGWGVIPGFNGTILLPKKVGMSNAIELILTGKMLSAQEALELKLVDYVVKENVVDFSCNLLKTITADRPIEVIHSVMKSLYNERTMSYEEATEEETKMVAKLVLEGIRARYGRIPE